MKRKLWRRALSVTAIVGGALLMWLSPEVLLGGAVMLAGIALEAIGIRLEHG